MRNSTLKKFIRTASLCAPLFGLFFLVSCAGNGQPLTDAAPQQGPSESSAAQSYYDYSDQGASAGSGTNVSAARNPDGTIGNAGFSFKFPGGDWTVIGGEDGAPYEFYNANSGRRAVLREVALDEGEPMNLMDRARMEMQSLESSGKKATLSELNPEEAFGTTGAFFDIAGKRYETPYEAVGMVTGNGRSVYTLTLTATDNVPAKDMLKEEWKEFFKGFTLNEIAEEQGPELSPERIQSHSSAALGYTWSTKDTLWHFWNGIAKQNNDPDLVLTDKSEEVSLFVYGAILPPDVIGQQDMFKVLLTRLGVDPNNRTLDARRVKVGDRYAQEFTLTHMVGKFDFSYKGRFFYENGRGILIAAWTQGATQKKYAKAIDNAIEGLKTGAVPEIKDDKKQNKFNAAVMNQVGILRLVEDQPLVALSYFERANKMDPEEPLYLVNCGFIYQMKELYGPGIAYFTSQMPLVRKNGKLLSILGEMYEVLFDYSHARECAEAALQFTPNNPEYVINLSDALWGLGQRHQSLVVVQRLYDTQPSSRLGVYLAKTYMGLDQYAEAVEILYGVRGRFGMSKDLGETLMDALVFLGRYEEARAISEETLQKEKNDYKLWTMHGKILFYSPRRSRSRPTTKTQRASSAPQRRSSGRPTTARCKNPSRPWKNVPRISRAC